MTDPSTPSTTPPGAGRRHAAPDPVPPAPDTPQPPEPDTPEPPVPDTKDWTWVLERACGFCGFDARRVTGAAVPGTVSEVVPRWRQVLGRDDVAVRPEPGVWSPLEYACHVRDVFGLFAQRATLILTENDPEFDDWDQDATAIAGRYWRQDPDQVADELAARGREVAAVFAAVPPESWGRPGRRSNGSVFTLDSLGRYLLHDVVHHLADVAGQLPGKRGSDHSGT